MLLDLVKFVAMKVPNYLLIAAVIFFVGCSDLQKALKSEDVKLKNDLALELYEQGKELQLIKLLEDKSSLFIKESKEK